MEIIKKIITWILLAFVVISIAVAFFKNAENRISSESLEIYSGSYIAVYYMHSTFRCSTCNNIEQMTLSVLDTSYEEDLANGNIKWQSVDFQENTRLAQHFGVVSSCVIVANVLDGGITDFKCLNDVWTLIKNPKEFDEYIITAINYYLKSSEGNL